MIADLFSTAVKRSIAQDYSVSDLLTAAERLYGAGETRLLLELYGIWIRHNGANPLLHAIYFNYGVALTDAKDLNAAKDAFAEAIKINPNFPPPYINLGGVLERLGTLDQAINQWTLAANCLGAVSADGIAHKTAALKQIGRVLETARIEANAEDALRQSLEIDPHQRDVVQHWIALRQTQCKWPVIVPWANVSRPSLQRAISPLSLAIYADDPVFQLANAHAYNKNDVKHPPSRPLHAPAPDCAAPRRLRVGYVSSDLREHAVGFLTSELFELHDREQVEIFAYYCGIRVTDSTQARLKRSADHWIDIGEMTDEQAAQKIAADRVDILVDLNGYTKDARLNVFARRPAPIIVNWLGFPGTMGSPYHNYIVADDFIAPAGSEGYFSEKVLRLACYQPNDRQRIVSPHRPTRAEAKLPEAAFVFCCFNGMQKIARPVFDSWMTILRSVPDSVLWLLAGTAETHERLVGMAEQRGVAKERLIFADRKGNPDHLARYPLADVFLDTSPYGAHTTASDALWMGVPVLTVPGQSFASRVCGSLVHAAGLGELVCRTPEEYVALAAELARDTARLEHVKTLLRVNRDSSVLFDTPGLVHRLEGLYRQMWADYAHGRLPQPDLSNLALLHEIACERDYESEACAAIGDHRPFYRERLAALQQISALDHDWRLSPPHAPGSEHGASARARPQHGDRRANGVGVAY
jgi:predicted O-linked N-acetylglucosamine transferase (SPINDLY family)